MSAIAKEANEFRQGRLNFYKDPSQDEFKRDINGLTRTVEDHLGRWPLELIQNCDDAQAERVLFRLTADAIYIADSG